MVIYTYCGHVKAVWGGREWLTQSTRWLSTAVKTGAENSWSGFVLFFVLKENTLSLKIRFSF